MARAYIVRKDAISNGIGTVWQGGNCLILMSFHPVTTLGFSCQLDVHSAAKMPDPEYRFVLNTVCYLFFCRCSLGAKIRF